MTAPAGPDGPARTRARAPRGPRTTSTDARMPLIEHIRELRNRVIKIALALIIGMVVGWFLYPHVWHFIEAPYCRADFATHLPGEANGPNNCHLYVTGIFDAFFLRLKISFIVGVILSSPVWLYQFWAFIAPGLYARERRWAYYFVGAAVPLFALGAVFAYFAMTRGLEFLLSLVPGNVTPLITITTYLSYAMAMLLIFGLAFELPLILVMLNLAGLLTHARFRKWRRVIIFAVFAFAAVATPSPDPLTMLLLAIPCVILVEIAEVFTWLNDRRRARLPEEDFAGLHGEQSRIDLDGVDEDLNASSR
jgi:sec-independent protein translocase protein TatC